MSKFCTKCGSPLTESARFCVNCGNPVAAAPQPAAETTLLNEVEETTTVLQDEMETTLLNEIPNVAPVEPVYVPPVEPVYAAPAEPVYTPPVEPVYATPAEPVYTPPVQPAYSAPTEYPQWNGEPVQEVPVPEQKKFKWWLILIILGGVALVGLLIWWIVDLCTNTYEAPLDAYVEFRNEREFSWSKQYDMLNGFAVSEYKDIVAIYEESDEYNLEKSWEDRVERYEDLYGSDYEYSYEIEKKRELDEDDLEAMEDTLYKTGKELEEFAEDYTTSDWRSLAENLGISVSEAKDLAEAIWDLGEEYKDAEVTEGYKLTVTFRVDGSKESEEWESTVCVYKVDGRWISFDLSNYLPHF